MCMDMLQLRMANLGCSSSRSLLFYNPQTGCFKLFYGCYSTLLVTYTTASKLVTAILRMIYPIAAVSVYNSPFVWAIWSKKQWIFIRSRYTSNLFESWKWHHPLPARYAVCWQQTSIKSSAAFRASSVIIVGMSPEVSTWNKTSNTKNQPLRLTKHTYRVVITA